MRLFTPLGIMMVVPHHVAYLIGQGFSKPVAALAFGSLGIFSFTSRICFGLLSDHLGQITTIILTYGPDFSVVLFRSDCMLVSEEHPMKVHKNQWLLTMLSPSALPYGATNQRTHHDP
jgi:hypothetical protein